jgi:hypothetical protein
MGGSQCGYRPTSSNRWNTDLAVGNRANQPAGMERGCVFMAAGRFGRFVYVNHSFILIFPQIMLSRKGKTGAGKKFANTRLFDRQGGNDGAANEDTARVPRPAHDD